MLGAGVRSCAHDTNANMLSSSKARNLMDSTACLETSMPLCMGCSSSSSSKEAGNKHASFELHSA